MKKIVIFFMLGMIAGLALGLSLGLLQPCEQKRIEVFCGAAASPVYEDAAKLFESEHGVKVDLTLGGSGRVLSAMRITKRGDLFIPGSPEYLLKAQELGVLDNSTEVRILAYMVPAIIVQKGNPENITCLEDLARPGIRVGIGDPESVCVGLYAKDMLEENGLWDGVEQNIVVYTPSCSATASLIPTKSVDAIIGWHVFRQWYPEKADIVWINPERIPRTSCIAGTVTVFAKDKESAKDFLDFLSSEEVNQIWNDYGYFATIDEAKLYATNATIAI